MGPNLAGKISLITSGLGLSTARRFVAEGAKGGRHGPPRRRTRRGRRGDPARARRHAGRDREGRVVPRTRRQQLRGRTELFVDGGATQI